MFTSASSRCSYVAVCNISNHTDSIREYPCETLWSLSRSKNCRVCLRTLHVSICCSNAKILTSLSHGLSLSICLLLCLPSRHNPVLPATGKLLKISGTSALHRHATFFILAKRAPQMHRTPAKRQHCADVRMLVYT